MDVLNGYCTQAKLQPYSEGEIVLAEVFLENSAQNDLRIYDRYFASFGLIFKHLKKEVQFVMRCKVDFNMVVKKFVASGKKQSVVEFTIPKNLPPALQEQGYAVSHATTVRVRLVRVEIGQVEPEILITSLLDLRKYPHSCFKELIITVGEMKPDLTKSRINSKLKCFQATNPRLFIRIFLPQSLLKTSITSFAKNAQKHLNRLMQKKLPQ